MKAYGELLNGKAAFSAPVLDVQEFLADRGLLESFRDQLQPLPGVVAMHDACHMIHGQGIQAQPRQLLPGLSLVRPSAGPCSGLPILTFPGNLGVAGTLREAWQRMEAG